MLKKVLVSLFIAGVLASTSSLFGTEEDSDLINIGTIRTTLRLFGLWDEFGEYLNAIDVTNPRSSGGGSNAGLVNYNEKLLKENADFLELTEAFYQDIKALDSEVMFLRGAISPVDRARMNGLEGRASLNNVVGDSYTSNLQPGWLWEKAMLYANNDKNLAIHLIGVCGHDDYHDPFQLVPGQENEICPENTSVMYMPKSLGANVDLSQDLKNRIIRSQAPTMGGRVLPAKYYHVIGSVFTSCLLKRRLNNPIFESQVENFQRGAILAYRSNRICNMLQEYLIFADREFVDSYRIDDPTLSNFDRDEIFCNGRSNCSTIRSAAYLTVTNPAFRQGGFLNCGRARTSRAMYTALGEVLNSPCPRRWTRDQCNAAKNRIGTWRVDFDWSLAQHSIGSDFATRNCPDLPRGRTGVDSAGSALHNLRILQNEAAPE